MISIIIMAMTVGFAIQQIMVLMSYRGTSFTTSILYDEIDQSYEFGYESDGFMMAFSLIDARAPDFQDPQNRTWEEIFDVQAGLWYRQYGNDIREVLETHVCTEEDYKKFYPVEGKWKDAKDFLESQGRWICFNTSEIYIKSGKFDPEAVRIFIDV